LFNWSASRLLLHDLVNREAAGVVRGLRMVGDPEILETTPVGGFGHCFQGLGTVGGIRMAVKDPAQVVVADELRQLALQSQLELTATLSEFGIDKGQA
jgi:hypothetical protein